MEPRTNGVGWCVEVAGEQNPLAVRLLTCPSVNRDSFVDVLL